MNDYNFTCPACNEECYFASNLNKHLQKCIKYEEWLKNYKIPESKTCEDCKRQIISEYFINHVMKCKK